MQRNMFDSDHFTAFLFEKTTLQRKGIRDCTKGLANQSPESLSFGSAEFLFQRLIDPDHVQYVGLRNRVLSR